MQLRDYQVECIDALLEGSLEDHVLAALPCGAGKTEIFMEILKRTPEKKSLIIFNPLVSKEHDEPLLTGLTKKPFSIKFSSGKL